MLLRRNLFSLSIEYIEKTSIIDNKKRHACSETINSIDSIHFWLIVLHMFNVMIGWLVVSLLFLVGSTVHHTFHALWVLIDHEPWNLSHWHFCIQYIFFAIWPEVIKERRVSLTVCNNAKMRLVILFVDIVVYFWNRNCIQYEIRKSNNIEVTHSLAHKFLLLLLRFSNLELILI